jgi:hypothetical protein
MEDNNTLTIDKDILVSSIAEISDGKIKIDWNNRIVIFSSLNYKHKSTFNEFLIKFVSIGRHKLYK